MKIQTMKKFILLIALVGFTGCDLFNPEHISDPNNPTVGSVVQNASEAQLQNLVSGLQERNRAITTNVVDILGSFGREFYPMYSSDPRFLGTWIGLKAGADVENDASILGGDAFWAGPYSVIKQANILIKSAKNSDNVTDQQKKGYIGFAQTIKAFQYIIPAVTHQHKPGIRIDVEDPLNPGPYVPYEKAMKHIRDLLDQAKSNLQKAGKEFNFVLTDGISDFNTPVTFIELNRAIYARAAVYDKKWDDALTALNDAKPFFELGTGKSVMNKGAYFVFTGPPDAFNPFFYKRNAKTNEILMVNPSMISDIESGDQRMDKFFKRNDAITSQTINGKTVSSQYQGNRFASNTSPFPWIRNEELILIYAEANAQLNNFGDALDAINDVRTTWGLADFTSTNKGDIIDQVLYNRQYSLWGEYGQRWIDARRYGRLDQLPKDKGKIYHYVALPTDETQWDKNHGGD